MDNQLLEKFDGLGNLAIQYGTKVAGALVLLIAALWISSRIKSLALKAMTKAKVDYTLAKFAGAMVKWSILVASALAILGMFGVETTSFAAVIAASGLAIGLAFQGALSNVAAGVMLLIFRPFKVDQFIQVAGETGTVNEVSLFTTVIDTPDNQRIIIPNSNVFGATIKNVTHHPKRRVDVPVGTAYDADLDKTRSVLNSVVKSTDLVLQDEANAVVLTGLGASSVDWAIRVWTNTPDYWTVRESILTAVKRALDEEKIGIPFPQMDVHLQGMPTVNISKADGAGAPLQ